MSGAEERNSDRSQAIVERVLAIEREADEIIAKAKAQESTIAASVRKYAETLRTETDTKISEELKRLSTEKETQEREGREALENGRREALGRIGGISPELLESCAKEVVSRILHGKE